MKANLKTFNASALQLAAMRGPLHSSGLRFMPAKSSFQIDDDEEVLSEKEFQQRVLGTGKKTQEKLDAVTTDVSRLDKETKSSLEEITKLKNSGAEEINALKFELRKLSLKLLSERSNALSNPIQRITGDDEKNARMAAYICLAHGKGNLAKKIMADAGLETKAGGEDSGFGATIITPDLAKDIYDSLPLYGAWNTLAVRRLGTKVTEYPVKTARALANWLTTEGAAISEDTTKAGTQLTLTVRPIGTLLSVSQQLLEDSPLDITADIMNDFVEGNAQCIDFAAFSGTGTTNATSGGYTGIFNGGTAAVAATGHNSIAEIDYNDVLSCLFSVDEVVLQRQARWWMHPFMLVRLMGIKDTTGRPIFQSILERPAPNAIGTILGYPVTLVSNAPYTDGDSMPLMAFGDPQAGVVGVRSDFKFESSDDYHFNTWQRAFRGISRACFGIRKATAFSVLTTAAS